MDWKARARLLNHQLGLGQRTGQSKTFANLGALRKTRRSESESLVRKIQLQQFKQEFDESVDDFLSCCRNQVTKCKFRDTTESDESIKKIQGRLLSKGDSLTLDQAIDVCRTYEATLSQLCKLHAEKSEEEKTSYVVGSKPFWV